MAGLTALGTLARRQDYLSIHERALSRPHPAWKGLMALTGVITGLAGHQKQSGMKPNCSSLQALVLGRQRWILMDPQVPQGGFLRERAMLAQP